jgi:hypothetical protein
VNATDEAPSQIFTLIAMRKLMLAPTWFAKGLNMDSRNMPKIGELSELLKRKKSDNIEFRTD